MSKQIHDEDGEDKITARIPSGLKSEFKKQADPNMSAVIEEMIRDYVGQSDESGDLEPFEEPEDRRLALAYRTLCEQHFAGEVILEIAQRALAKKLDNRGKEDTTELFRRLEDKGYCKFRETGIGRQRKVKIHVRPWSKRIATEDLERLDSMPKPSFEQVQADEREERVNAADRPTAD